MPIDFKAFSNKVQTFFNKVGEALKWENLKRNLTWENIKRKFNTTYSSIYDYFQHATIEEKGAWVAIALGSILVIIGLFML